MSAATATISLLTIPAATGKEHDPPDILIDRRGFWRGPIKGQTPLPVPGFDDKKQEIEKLLDDTMIEVEKARKKGTPFDAAFGLRAKLTQYYAALVPPAVRAAINDVAIEAQNADVVPKLHVHAHSGTEWVPWEILHDGQDYLGLRFQVARLPIVEQGPELMDTVHPVRRIYSLLGEHALEASEIAEFTAWADTFAAVTDPSVTVTRFPDPTANGAMVFPLVDEMADAATNLADIIHVTCHGGRRDKTSKEPYWTLNHRDDVPFRHRVDLAVAKSLELRSSRPLIFGNACAWVGGETVSPELRSGLKPPFAATFFDFGALAYVGAFAPVVKETAIKFATTFYRNLLGDGGQPGLPIGEALWKTKTAFRPAPGADLSDPSWLFYCLYGLPELQFKIGE